MSMCVGVWSVCLRAYLQNYTFNIYPTFAHVAYGRGLVLLRRRRGVAIQSVNQSISQSVNQSINNRLVDKMTQRILTHNATT